MSEDGGQIVSDDTPIGFYIDRADVVAFEKAALKLVRQTNMNIKVEVNFNKEKTKAMINFILLNCNS